MGTRLFEPYFKALSHMRGPYNFFMGIDPSNDVDKCGLAVVRADSSIMHLMSGEDAFQFLEEMPLGLKQKDVLCSVERQEYHSKTAKSSPANILTLALAAGVLVQKVRASVSDILTPTPHEWTHGLAKEARATRLLQSLSPLNLARVEGALSVIPKRYQPDALDALGLALWTLQAWESRVVIDMKIREKRRKGRSR